MPSLSKSVASAGPAVQAVAAPGYPTLDATPRYVQHDYP